MSLYAEKIIVRDLERNEYVDVAFGQTLFATVLLSAEEKILFVCRTTSSMPLQC